MKNIIRKITSRKFILALAGIFTGIAMALGVDSTEITTVAGGVTALASAVAYIIVEGKVDAEAVKNAVESAQEAVETVNKEGE